MRTILAFHSAGRQAEKMRHALHPSALSLPPFRRGQAYLEFLIVLPGLLLLLFLAWELAYFWWGRMVVSTGTFEAARQVAVGEPVAKGYGLYGEVLSTGLGRMSTTYRGGFTIAVQPAQR